MKILIVTPVKSGTHLIENFLAESLNIRSIHLSKFSLKFVSIKEALELNDLVSTHSNLFSESLKDYLINNNNIKIIRIRRDPIAYTNSVLNWNIFKNIFPYTNFNDNLKWYLELDDENSFVWSLQNYLKIFNSWDYFKERIIDLKFEEVVNAKVLSEILSEKLNIDSNLDLDNYKTNYHKNILFAKIGNYKPRLSEEKWNLENIELFNILWKGKFDII